MQMGHRYACDSHVSPCMAGCFFRAKCRRADVLWLAHVEGSERLSVYIDYTMLPVNIYHCVRAIACIPAKVLSKAAV